MASLDYLRRAGLAVELEGERLRVTPADRITADLRQFVRDHRAELVEELSASIGRSAPERPALRLVESTTRLTSAEPLPAATAATAAPSPAPAAEAASEPMRNAWTITRGGKPICRMVGAPCPRTEALAEARWRWPDADILES